MKEPFLKIPNFFTRFLFKYYFCILFKLNIIKISFLNMKNKILHKGKYFISLHFILLYELYPLNFLLILLIEVSNIKKTCTLYDYSFPTIPKTEKNFNEHMKCLESRSISNKFYCDTLIHFFQDKLYIIHWIR